MNKDKKPKSKERSKEYEKKLKINTSLDDVLKASVPKVRLAEDLRGVFAKLGYKSYEFDSYNLLSKDHIGDITLKGKGSTIKIMQTKNDTLESLIKKILKEEEKLK